MRKVQIVNYNSNVELMEKDLQKVLDEFNIWNTTYTFCLAQEKN